LLGEKLIGLFLAVKRHEVAKAAEHARDYAADDWPTGRTSSRSWSCSSSVAAGGRRACCAPGLAIDPDLET
jgi:hypothetical protein